MNVKTNTAVMNETVDYLFPAYLITDTICDDFDVFSLTEEDLNSRFQISMIDFYSELYLEEYRTRLIQYQEIHERYYYVTEQDMINYREQLLSYVRGSEVLTDLKYLISSYNLPAANDDSYEQMDLFSILDNFRLREGNRSREKTDFIEITELKSNTRSFFSLVFKTTKGKFHMKIRRRSRGNYSFKFDVLMWENDVTEEERVLILKKNYEGKHHFTNKEDFINHMFHRNFFRLFLKFCNITPRIFDKEYRRKKYETYLPVI